MDWTKKIGMNMIKSVEFTIGSPNKPIIRQEIEYDNMGESMGCTYYYDDKGNLTGIFYEDSKQTKQLVKLIKE
jgi:hypothetical protein